MIELAWYWWLVAVVVVVMITAADSKGGGAGGAGDVRVGWRARMTQAEKDAGLGDMNEARRNLAPLPQAASPLAALVWDDELERKAQVWVDTCSQGHSATTGVGENIAWGAEDLSGAVRMWNAEKKNVAVPLAGSPVVFSATASNWCSGGWSKCAHYTQDIWSSTRRVGCARPTNACGQWGDKVFVCNFSPPGNMIGRPVYPVS
jgi:Cysteine-rich secretory protein family